MSANLSKNQLEDDLFVYFQNGASEAQVEEIADRHNLTIKQVEQVLDSHYYLSPKNLSKAQLLIAILTIIMSLTITIVRTNNDWFLIVVSLVIGLAASIPFFIIYLLVRNLRNMAKFEALTKISLIYLIFLAALFAVVAVNSQIYGAILIPVLVIGFYILELVKFNKLKRKLSNTNVTNSSGENVR